jgi:CubicO group peptidase (beta-lactamase class C family)
LVPRFLKSSAKREPGSEFEYGPSHFYAFGELMNRKLSQQSEIHAKSFEQYARLRLIDPLGIRIGVWSKDASGNVNIPGGMFLTAREWAKFGQFVLDQGESTQADGTKVQLLPADLLRNALFPRETIPPMD